MLAQDVQPKIDRLKLAVHKGTFHAYVLINRLNTKG